MKIINLTPHKISIYKDDILVRTYESKGVARVFQKSIVVDNIDGIFIYKNIYGDVSGLPEETSNTFYIVSKIVADACPHRSDLLLTNDCVRNEEGVIIGCRSLSRV